MNNPFPPIDFSNTATAFSHKSDKQLKHSYRLFYLMNFKFLTSVGTWFIKMAFNLNLPIKGLVKSTLFNHFCGGESINDCEKTIEELAKSGIGTILDYSVEGEKSEEAFEQTAQEIIKTIEKAKSSKHIPFSVFKVTGVAAFDLLEKHQLKKIETPSEKEEFERVKNRIEKICRTAYEAQVPIFIDAEETWIQNSIDNLAYDMMAAFNKEKAIVYNTIQCYRKDSLELLYDAHRLALEKNFKLGLKLVRGAYMEKEREHSKQMGYENPINNTKENTDNCYNSALEFCLKNNQTISICAGTHNEKSSNLLAKLLTEYGLDKNASQVYFAQLYGMSDHISFNLSNLNYNVAKYVPYGPVKAVLPYLFRRAEENKSIAGQTSREFNLIKKEILRRKI